MSKIAIYPGSFDPFTNGHLDIVKKAAKVFDSVIILICVNNDKKRTYDDQRMMDAINDTLQANKLDNCTARTAYMLIAEYAKKLGIRYMIRGLRNNMDYNYEENIAEINKLINPDLECVYFRADNVGISSSMVKELYSYGQDISKYLPKEILEIVC